MSNTGLWLTSINSRYYQSYLFAEPVDSKSHYLVYTFRHFNKGDSLMSKFVLATALLVVVANAETQGTNAVSTNKVASSSAVKASIEARPSVKFEPVTQNGQTTQSKMPKYYSENTIDVGYQFNSKLYAGYRQFFDTDLYSFSDHGARLGASNAGSILRVKINDIWSNSSSGTSLGYEPRLYLPLEQSMKDAGNVVRLRNYIVLSQKVTDSVTVSLMEIPILHSYNRAGVLDSTGKGSANPAFENRVYLLTSVSLTGSLSFDFPLMLNSVRSATFQNADGSLAENSGRLSHKLWIYPELSYQVDPTWTVGAAYYSDNLLDYKGGDYQGLDLSTGLEQGVAQLLVKASL